MLDHLEKILIDEEKLIKRVKELGAQITEDYKDKDLFIIVILKGAVMFASDLIKEIKLPLAIDFMAVSSYGASTKSSGVVRIMKDLEEQIEGKDVLIVEDIVDTGLTLNYLFENLLSRKPRSLKVCCCLDKPSRRKAPVNVDYVGFNIPDEFVIGYGLDYAEKYRNLPFIGVLSKEAYAK
ncbi:MAG TPA: hypoxanthine phosphoribosyltransferase [Candidatus Atribacteria bacterium]|nr:hypoxanthine phosphoribosyltransferase [Candidatus Atribacteria bacterium]HPT78397.1 hypoxanthine phosphoribosyltransferase [Candidatus Atribacteria bacterium]